MSASDWPVERDRTYGCWVWVGKRDRGGYGVLHVNGSTRMAHLVVFEAEVGPIADGLDGDHICRNRACCNPEHLELVTRRENLLRRSWRYRVRTMTACKAGHDLKLHGIVTPGGGRVCRACVRAS